MVHLFKPNRYLPIMERDIRKDFNAISCHFFSSNHLFCNKEICIDKAASKMLLPAQISSIKSRLYFRRDLSCLKHSDFFDFLR